MIASTLYGIESEACQHCREGAFGKTFGFACFRASLFAFFVSALSGDVETLSP